MTAENELWQACEKLSARVTALETNLAHDVAQLTGQFNVLALRADGIDAKIDANQKIRDERYAEEKDFRVEVSNSLRTISDKQEQQAKEQSEQRGARAAMVWLAGFALGVIGLLAGIFHWGGGND